MLGGKPLPPPPNCQTAFYATGIFLYNLNKVLSNRFVRTTTASHSYPHERGISINAQILTSDEKRIEIASDFYQATFENTDQIHQYNYDLIKE